jgi:hypothetical protein
MKKFFLKLLLLTFCIALGYLGWRVLELRHENNTLRTKLAEQPRAPKPEEQAELRRQVEEQTSEIRGLPFKHPVDYKMIARNELRALLVGKVREQYSEQEIRDYSRSLAALGLVPAGTDLLDAMVSLYDEQVGAFYVPEERALYTFKDLAWTSGLDKMLLSHELTHALQDQNFDLTTFALKVKDNDDLALANAALIEGDATLEMTLWYAQHTDPGHILGDVAAMLKQNVTKLRDAPPYLREMLLFPYQEGQTFAMALYSDGGTAALNAAFRNPPRSTQQILHPEKFLTERHDPVAVEVPPVQSPGWRLIGNNVLGEFGIRSLLGQESGAWEAQLVAQGWRGDRYHAYERGKDGPTAVVWVTVWDGEPSAAEFEDAYNRLDKKREATPQMTARVHRDGVQVTIQRSADPSFFELLGVALAR